MHDNDSEQMLLAALAGMVVVLLMEALSRWWLT